jgi:hypothetical protein
MVLGLEDDDTIDVMLTTMSGRHVVINTCQAVHGLNQRHKVLGTLGLAQSEATTRCVQTKPR